MSSYKLNLDPSSTLGSYLTTNLDPGQKMKYGLSDHPDISETI